jgi:hypothetical protein
MTTLSTKAAVHWVHEHHHLHLPHQVHLPHHLHVPHLPPARHEDTAWHAGYVEDALMRREMYRL